MGGLKLHQYSIFYPKRRLLAEMLQISIFFPHCLLF